MVVAKPLRWWSTFALAILLVATSAAIAQTSKATLRGTVTDPSGAIVPGAEITVTDVGTNVEVRRLITDTNGNFEVPELNPGTYRVKAEMAGFRSFVADALLLDAAQVRRVDVVLQIGANSETITVSAGAALITTESGTISGEIDKKRFADQPAIDVYPSPLALLTTVPGIQGNGWNLVISGLGRNQQTWAMDGVPNDTTGDQNDNPNFSEAVQVTTVIPGAESARATNFNLISKRGTNQYHGGVYYKHFNSALNARQFFEDRKTPFIQHEWDAEAGGPIWKNRTFFYASWFHQSIPLGSYQLRTVPTLLMRQGVFSTAVRDPLTGVAFANNTIPASRISPVAKKIQDLYYPEPNIGSASTLTNNYGWVFPFNADLYKGDWPFVRADHNVSKNNTLGFRWSQRKTPYILAQATPGLNRTRLRDHRQTVLTDTHVFTPRMVNTFTFGWQTDLILDGEEEKGIQPIVGDDVVKAIGLQGVNPKGYRAQGFPTVSISGLTTLSSTAGGIGNVTVDDYARTFQDTATWSRGKHVLKFGGEYRQYQQHRPGISSDTYGNFSFNGQLSGSAYADFLLGLPSTATRLDPLTDRFATEKQVGLFVTDTFKISSRLTVDFGLRWDYYSSPTYADGLMWNWDPTTGNVLVAQGALSKIHPLYPKTIKVAEGDVVPSPDKGNFRPRLSAAYRAGKGLVIRGGYGEYTESFGYFARLLGAGPFQIGETYTPNVITNGVPLLAFPNPFPSSLSSATVPSQSPQGYPMQTDNGVIRQYNLSVEREWSSIGLRASYIGSRGGGLNYNLNTNKPQPSLTAFSAARRPYPQFVNTTVARNDGLWHYDSMQLEAKRRVGSFTFLGEWTWSNNMNNYGITENPYDVTSRWQRDDADRRQYATVATTWAVPVGRGRRFMSSAPSLVNHVLGGWNLQTISYFGSGQYFSPNYSGFDASNTNTTSGLPDRIADGNKSGDAQTVLQWFDPAAFVRPSSGRFGNSGGRVLVSQGLNAHHLSVAKTFALTERLKFTMTGSISNLFNHPHFNTPLNNISNPDPGKFTSTVPYYNPEKQGFRQSLVKLRLEF